MSTYTQYNDKLIYLAKSGIASSTAAVTVLPIQTIASTKSVFPQQRYWHITKNIWNNFGIMGFYNSALTQVGREMTMGVFRYGTYFLGADYIKNENTPIIYRIPLAAGSGALGALATNIFDTHIIKQQTKCYTSGYFRGLTANVSRGTIAASVQLPTYSYLKDYFNNVPLASILTTFTVTSIVHPVTVWRNRVITNKKIKLNIKTLYGGYFLTLVRYVPSFLIYTTVFELLT